MTPTSKQPKSEIVYRLEYRVDPDILCDRESLKEDFNNSWQEFMEWFYKEEPGEVILGFNSEPKLIWAEEVTKDE